MPKDPGRPSGHRLQPSLIQSIVDHVREGQNDCQIGRSVGVDPSTVRKYRLNVEYFGEPYAPRCVRIGRPPLLRQCHRDALLNHLQGKPTCYLDEMQAFLYDDFDLPTSVSTIWRALNIMRWSRKAVSKAARERHDGLRRVFRARCQQIYKPDQVICLDESACNERTGDRKYGWAPINTPANVQYSAKRSERWSVLPAMDVNGYVDHMVFQGAITAELMEEFVANKVLPHCSPWPGPRSVIVLDNASIHRSATLASLCAEAGVILEFLPPYSPDINPIEQTFKALKSWVKRNCDEAEAYESFEYFLEEGIQRVCYDSLAARGFFRFCGWAA
jgi:transposase